MIVQRLTWLAKRGHVTEAVKLAMAERERTGSTHRLYESYFGPQNTVAAEFEFEDFEDLEIGGRWQYFRNETWKLAFTGGVRLPTGRKDDPENLGDVGFGTGAYALLFRLNQDLTLFQEEGPLKRFTTLGFLKMSRH